MMMVQYYVTCYECTHYGGEHGEGNVGKVWGGNKREGTVGREAPHTNTVLLIKAVDMTCVLVRSH